MADNFNRTSANAIITISVPEVLIANHKIAMAGTDKFFSVESQDTKETMIGVDGKMTVGIIFTMTTLTLTVAPGSDSHTVFNAIYEYERTTLRAAKITGVIQLPSIGRKYTFDTAFLKNIKYLPEGGKVLGDLDYKIDIERLYLAPV